MRQVAVGAIVVATLLPIGSCQKTEPDYPPPGGGAGTDQGWDYATAQAWYHVDQGTAFFPYEWFVALTQAQGEEHFAAPGNMQRFGFLPNPPHQTFNPDGLPIGFSRTELRLDKGAFQCWQGNWVGLTCAACHTGQVNYHGTALLIEGGPAQNDIETFRIRLAEAFARQCYQSPEGAGLRRARAGAAAGPEPGRRAGGPAVLRPGQRGTRAHRAGGAGGGRRSRRPLQASPASTLSGAAPTSCSRKASASSGTTSRPPRRSASRHCGTRRTSIGFSTTTRCASRSPAASSRRSASAPRSIWRR